MPKTILCNNCGFNAERVSTVGAYHNFRCRCCKAESSVYVGFREDDYRPNPFHVSRVAFENLIDAANLAPVID